MRRFTIALAFLVGLLVATAFSVWSQYQTNPLTLLPRANGQETKSKITRLPRGWSKLGLSEKQKKDAFAIVEANNKKIEALRMQIAKIQEEERQQLTALLTADQKKELRKYAEEKTGLAEEAKPKEPEKKP